MDRIEQLIDAVVKALYGELEVKINLVQAPKETGADFATNIAMSLARVLKRNPWEIATEIVGELEKSDLGFKIDLAKPGFMNIKMGDEFYKEELGQFESKFLEKISSDEYLDQTVICEFSDPNPFKILHVGHLYTSMVGDAISRLVEFAGGRVIEVEIGRASCRERV